MSNQGNPGQYLTRVAYAWTMAVLIIAVPVLEWILWRLYPNFERFSAYVNTGVFCAIAIFTGARLADAGYRRWFGVAGVFLIGIGTPIGSALVGIFVLRLRTQELMALLPVFAIALTLVLIVFVVWAGTRRSAPRGAIDDYFDDENGDDHLSGRIEPRF
jgi:hypothetical protein